MVKAWAWSSGFPCQLVLACSVVLGLAQGGGHAQPPVSELAPCPQEDAHTRCLIQKRPRGAQLVSTTNLSESLWWSFGLYK